MILALLAEISRDVLCIGIGTLILALLLLCTFGRRPPSNSPTFTCTQPAVTLGGKTCLSADELLFVIRQLALRYLEAQRKLSLYQQQQLVQIRQAKNSNAQAVALSTKKEVEELQEAWQCRICLNADVDVVLTACGHMLCLNCSSGCHQRCPFCRRQSPIIRLYN